MNQKPANYTTHGLYRGQQTCHSFRFYLNHSDFFSLKFSEIQITWLKIQIFFGFEFGRDFYIKVQFDNQIQILFCVFRFFLTFIQVLCQIQVAGLGTTETDRFTQVYF